MAVAFRDKYENQVNSTTLPITITSTSLVGDTAVAVISTGIANNVITSPAGWTAVGAAIVTTSQSTQVFNKVLASGDIGVASSFGVVTGGKMAGSILTFSGATGSIGGSAQGSANATSASRTSPALASTGMAIEIMSTKGTEPGAWTPPAGFTSRSSIFNTGTGSVSIGVATSTSNLAGGNTWTSGISATQYQATTMWLTAAGTNAAPTAVASGYKGTTNHRTGVSASGSGTSVSAKIPANAVVGDVAVAQFTHAAGAGLTLTAPAGWTQLGATTSATSMTSALFYKVLAAGDINSAKSWESSASGLGLVSIVVYSGAHATTPIGGHAVQAFTSSSASRLAASLSGVGRMLEFASTKGDSPEYWTQPSGANLRESIAQEGVGVLSQAVSDSRVDLSSGNDTWTTATAKSQAVMWSVWLLPASEGNTTAVAPGTTVIMDGAASTDGDGSIASYGWAQTSGSTAGVISTSGAKASIITPTIAGGGNMVFTLTVTDNLGATATTTITVAVTAPAANVLPAASALAYQSNVQFRTSTSVQGNFASFVPKIGPEAQPEDYAFAVFTQGLATSTLSAPNGWTQLGAVQTTASQRTAVFYKKLDDVDINTNLTFTATGSGKGSVAIVVYAGVSPTNPIGGFAFGGDSTSSASRTSPALSASNILIEAAVTKGTDPTQWTVPTGFTKRVEAANAGTGATLVAIAESKTDLSAGDDTWSTAAVNTQYTMLSLWLRPAVGGDGQGVEPESVITLDGSGSADSDGSITSYGWTQVGGSGEAAITGSGSVQSAVAPLTLDGAFLTFRLTVTDNLGAVSTANVGVKVLSATHRQAQGGVWIPLRSRFLAL